MEFRDHWIGWRHSSVAEHCLETPVRVWSADTAHLETLLVYQAPKPWDHLCSATKKKIYIRDCRSTLPRLGP